MGRKLRVVMASPRNRACGIADYATFLYEKLGPELECSWLELPTTSSVQAWRQAAARADGANVAHVHFEPALFQIPRPYINRFATFMKRLRPSALVSLHDRILPLCPRWFEKKPYGFGDLLRDLAYLPFFAGWEKAQYGRAEHFLVHSPEMAAYIGDLAGPGRVTHILHPVPSVGCVWSAKEDHPLDLVSPGFIKAHKGFQDLLDLMHHLPFLKWDLAGSPQDQYDRVFTNCLEKRIRELGLADRIRITGYLTRRRMEDLATRAKAAIFPFRWAAGSGSLTWAVGLGLPVLATDLPVIVQFKDAGAGVKLLPRDNRKCWPERIAKVLNDPEEQALLSEANIKFARHHSYNEFARQVEGLYRLLGNRET